MLRLVVKALNQTTGLTKMPDVLWYPEVLEREGGLEFGTQSIDKVNGWTSLLPKSLGLYNYDLLDHLREYFGWLLTRYYYS